jgi:hypothetical protein
MILYYHGLRAQVLGLYEQLCAAGHSVWCAHAMADRSAAAVREGVVRSDTVESIHESLISSD